MTYPDPRMLVCVLGKQLAPLVAAARAFPSATTFTFDEENSHDEPDDRMEMSFGVCWDRVVRGAYTDEDEQAVVEHGCAMYVVTPPLARDATLPAARDTVMLVEHLLGAGATAVKIESSGVAHGAARWRQLAGEIRGSTGAAHARACRLAVTKRPLGGGKFFETLGNHLVGLPEVYVPLKSVKSDRDAVKIMDEVGDELVADGLDAVLARRSAKLDRTSQYEGDFEFKINPYGVVKLPKSITPALRPSRPGL